MEESFWKQTYEKILIGMGLLGITLNVLFLNQLLPFIGVLLLFTGFRKLRSENLWLKAGYAGAVLKVVITIVIIVLGSVIEREKIYASYAWKGIAFCGGILPTVLMVCFFLGMREELEQREEKIKIEVLLHIIVWYIVVTVLAVQKYDGWFLGLAIVAAYIGILMELKNIAENLEQAGYVLEEHPARISDSRYAAGAAILTAAGLFIGYICFGFYHMEWTTAKEVQDPACEEIKTHLLSLGFPEEILKDLMEEDILACKNARQVLLNQNDDLQQDEDERLQLDGVAVELEQEGQWKVIHHFLWNGNPGFLGTEAVQINPAYQELNGGWISQGKLTGQVLYDKNGTSYTADYTILQDENYDTGMNAFFYGSQQYASIFAEFSMPRRGENCRGYVAYEIKAKERDWWIDSWINYIHQKSIWQYPVISAAQHRKQGGWLEGRVFSTVQDALQVLPEGESEGSIDS